MQDDPLDPPSPKPPVPPSNDLPEERSEVTPDKEGTFRVWLEGAFPTGWIASLSMGLARANIGIVSGVARKSSQRRWTTAMVVRPQSGAARPEDVDYLGLAHQRHPPEVAAPIALQSFEVVVDDKSGALLLEVTGQDRIGFLGSLLDRLAGLALFPEDMTIETQDDKALDRFALKAPGGQTPSAEAHQALMELLEGLRRP
jgi:hypothetical protein